MNKWLKSFKVYQLDRNDILNKVKTLSEEQFHEKAANGGWSVQQILIHLIEVEEVTVALIKKSSEEKAWKPVRFKKKFYSFILNYYLKSNKKFQIPSVLNQPENTISQKEILEKWKTINKTSEVVVVEFQRENKKMGVFKHPKTGWLNISQSINFMRFHQNHHIRQLNAKLSELN